MSDTGKPWDPALYDGRHSFVWKAGAELIDLLAPLAGERILDLGCGTGHLTSQIAARGAEVWGLDHSEAMVAEARRIYPSLRFEVGDAMDFHFPVAFDAVFSNAALHWMTRPAAAAACILAALRPGGRFVAEMGGKGNVHAIHSALEAVIREAGHVPLPESTLLYFPTIAQYATVLEAAGLRVTEARHFDRPIRLEGGEDGLRNWIRMFADRFMAVVPDVAREDILGSVETRVRHELHRDGAWHADYRRLRVFAVRM